jgi:2-oxo-3-hexenedioate decarboxylase
MSTLGGPKGEYRSAQRDGATGNLAHTLLAALDEGRLITPPAAADPAFDLPAAFAVADELRRLRIARGEKPLGYKIGFTNRNIWPRYGVHAPIWGPVWDSTVQRLEGDAARVSLAELCQPRLEPEIVFGFASTPRAGMDLDALQGCIAWVAHGFEIVHTHFDGWRFAAADTVADFALHGRLFIGRTVPVADWPTLAVDLAALEVKLSQDGEPRERGVGANVLDGPLNALRLWVDAMARDTPFWTIASGDVVTTGTITDAWPLAPGQRWSTTLSDPRLAPLTLQTVA